MAATATKQPPLVRELETLPASSSVPAVAAPPAVDIMQVIAQLAGNPSVDVAKIEKLIEMQERILRHQAKAAFDAAFSLMQGKLPVIDEKGRILVNGELRSKYAKFEDIQAAIRPVLAAFGFSLRHRNEHVANNQLKIVGILSHRDGHSEQDEFLCPPDTSGGKQAIQAIGSTRSYGMRYTTIALLNLETRGVDDDGQKAGEQEKPDGPAGFDDWRRDIEACADEGIGPLTTAFNKSKKDYQQHLLKHFPREWAALKNKAQKAGQ